MRKIAVVGAGQWSSKMHLPVLRRLQEQKHDQGPVNYVAVCDADIERARTFASALDAAAHTSLEDMLGAHQLDGLAILVNPEAAEGCIEIAIGRKLPFLVEKPPALTPESHQRLAELAGSLPHLVAYNRRFSPFLRQAQAWLKKGEAQSLHAQFTRHERHDPDFTSTAVHAIDSARFLAGDFCEAAIASTPVADSRNFFISGWTTEGCRMEIAIMPLTASSQEHYILRGRERSVVVVYPFNVSLEESGFVELHEKNKVVKRKTHLDFGLDVQDASALAGIYDEHLDFCNLLGTEAQAVSTLHTSLQTAQIRAELKRQCALSGPQSGLLSFDPAKNSTA